MYYNLVNTILLFVFLSVHVLAGDNLLDALSSLLGTYLGNVTLLLVLSSSARDTLLGVVGIALYRAVRVLQDNMRNLHLLTPPLHFFHRWLNVGD